MSCSWRSLRPTIRVGNLLGWEVGRDGRHRRHRDGIRGKQPTDRSSPSLHASRVVVPECYPSCTVVLRPMARSIPLVIQNRRLVVLWGDVEWGGFNGNAFPDATAHAKTRLGLARVGSQCHKTSHPGFSATHAAAAEPMQQRKQNKTTKETQPGEPNGELLQCAPFRVRKGADSPEMK